jgi:hypothetical protein
MFIETAGTLFKIVSRVKEENRVISVQCTAVLVLDCSSFPFCTFTMVTPFSRVQNSGFYFMVSNAACIMKKNKTGPSNEPCRIPIELSILESTEPIFTLIFAFL